MHVTHMQPKNWNKPFKGSTVSPRILWGEHNSNESSFQWKIELYDYPEDIYRECSSLTVKLPGRYSKQSDHVFGHTLNMTQYYTFGAFPFPRQQTGRSASRLKNLSWKTRVKVGWKVAVVCVTDLTGSVRSPLRRSISLWGTGYQRKLSFQLKPPYVMSDPAMYSNVSSLITSIMGHTTVLLRQSQTRRRQYGSMRKHSQIKLLFKRLGGHQRRVLKC